MLLHLRQCGRAVVGRQNALLYRFEYYAATVLAIVEVHKGGGNWQLRELMSHNCLVRRREQREKERAQREAAAKKQRLDIDKEKERLLSLREGAENLANKMTLMKHL